MFNLKDLMNKIDDYMLAVTFAEAGEHKTALRFIRPGSRKRRKKRVEKESTRQAENRPTLEC